MAFKISQEWYDELYSRVRIDEVVGQYVQLTPKGRDLWACCPFHNEKTPSFKVDVEEGLFYCFGCHKGGNIITFIREYEHIDFMEAVELLAEKAHMTLPNGQNYDPDEQHKQDAVKQKIYEANLFAARFFHKSLKEPQGAQALKYLYGRGFNDNDIRRFGLGYSPERGAQLHDELIKAGFEEEIIQKAWLSGEKDGRSYDMFRNRVMFPIIDRRDRVVGFGGRVMGKDEPKYLNTADTPVFLKRNGVYGLNFIKGARLNRLVLTEGYMDTVMLLKQGIVGVVATLGTALTEEQIRLMKRYSNQIWVSYDGDPPGRKAALRALDMLEPAGCDVRVIDYPSNMDPDEYIKAFGVNSWENLPKHRAAKYRLLRAEDGLDLSTQEGMTEYTVRSCAILKKVSNEVERENYLRELISKTGYPRDVLIRQIGLSKVEPSQAPKPFNRPAQSIAPKSENELAQIQLIAMLNKGLINPEVLNRQDFDSEIYAEVYDDIKEGIKLSTIIENLPQEQIPKLMEAINYSPLPDNSSKALMLTNELLATIQKSRLESRISIIKERLKTANDDERKALMSELNELLLKL